MAEAFSSQHTQNFPQFLSQMGISILVTTYQAGKLISLRAQDNVLNTHFVSMEKPMGVALQGANLVVGTGAQVIHYYNMPDVGSKVLPANTHDACYIPRSTHITGDIDIHEMGFTDDKELWLLNTKMSCLCTLDPEYSIVPRWKPPFITGYDLTDRCHLNGLAMRDGEPRYVTALGTTDTAGGWRQNKAAGGMLMDVTDNRMIAQGLSMPHSPRWYQDQLWVLESGAGSLATVDEATGELTTIVELPGFTRGLDFIDRYAIIGLSQVRETAVFAGLPLTERCDDRQCGVYIVDIIEKQVVAFLVFSGEVQEIFAVQILPARMPAVLDITDPLLRGSYALPDAALKEVEQPDETQQQLAAAGLLYQEGKIAESVVACMNLLKKSPNNTEARFRLGIAHLDLRQWLQAVEAFEHLIKHDPNHAEGYNSLGLAYNGLKDWQQAKASFDKAIEIDQQYAVAQVNRAMILLREGEFAAGWEGLEWRWKMPGNKPLNCKQPQWTSALAELADKTILVHTEQDEKEAIQFARFLPMLVEHCRQVIVMCAEPLRLFFKGIEGVDAVYLPQQVPEEGFDAYIPIMSLANVLGIMLENLPTDNYIGQLAEVVVPTLKSSGDLKIGLAWTPQDKETKESPLLSLADLIVLTDLPGMAFYSLQNQLTAEEAKQLKDNNITPLGDELVSVAHAAALIEQLDIVITIENSLAHLSGGLGKAVLTVLDDQADWRWGIAAGDNSWYPSMMLCHASEQSMMVQIRTGLLAWMAKR